MSILWWMCGMSLEVPLLSSRRSCRSRYPLQLMHLESPPRVPSLPLAPAGCYPAASRHLPTPTQAVCLAPTISWIASSSSWALLPSFNSSSPSSLLSILGSASDLDLNTLKTPIESTANAHQVVSSHRSHTDFVQLTHELGTQAR